MCVNILNVEYDVAKCNVVRVFAIDTHTQTPLISSIQCQRGSVVAMPCDNTRGTVQLYKRGCEERDGC